jgi:hypothetical protein
MAITTVTLNATRRHLLAQPGAVSAAARALAADPDPHVEWAERLQELVQPERADGLAEAAYEALMDEVFALRDRISETPAQGLSGVIAQLWSTIGAIEGGYSLGECELVALRNALATLKRLQARKKPRPHTSRAELLGRGKNVLAAARVAVKSVEFSDRFPL